MFDRITVKITMAVIHLCFGGDPPLDYVKKYSFVIFFFHNCIIKRNDSTKQDYNLDGIFPIYFKYMALKI